MRDFKSRKDSPSHSPSLESQTVNSHRTNTTRQVHYDVYMTAGNIESCCEVLEEMVATRAALLISTPTVARLYASQIYDHLRKHSDRISLSVLDCSEATKSISQVERVCEKATDILLDRTGLIVGIGGGVCTDIATFAASWIRRGVGYIRVPTTLLGQVDAGVGIKGGVNFCGKKSYLGCFYPPKAVVITPWFLRSLSPKSLREGFAEMIKIAIVRDRHLFELLEKSAVALLNMRFTPLDAAGKEVLWLAATGMMDELEPNLFEDQTYRRLVDFGHTFSPALEAASNFEISHGEAVAIDMALTMVVGDQLGLMPSEDCTRTIKLLLDLQLPVWSPLLTFDLCLRGLQESALHRGGTPNLVVPTSIGQAIFIEQIDTLLPVLDNALALLRRIGQGVNEIMPDGPQNLPLAADSMA